MAGRKKLPKAESSGLDIVEKTPPELAKIEAEMRDAGELATGEQVQAWIRMGFQAGRIQAATVAATVSERMIAEAYRDIAESRGYMGMPYVAADGTRGNVSSIDEFCQVCFGKTARRCRQIASNYELIGEELFEAAQQIGFGQRDYNALKTLPADEQEAVRTAIAEGGDREAVTGLIKDLVERLVTEKAELKADALAKDERASQRERTIENLQKQLRQAKGQRERATPDEEAERLKRQFQAAALGVEIALTSEDADTDCLRNRTRDLIEHARAHERDVLPYLAGVFAQLERMLWLVRDEFGIPHAAVGDPEKEAAMTLGEAL